MEYSFIPDNVIKTVKRTAKVTIAGFAIAIAVVATPIAPNLNNLTIPDPLEQVIAYAVPSDRMPEFNIVASKIVRDENSMSKRSEMLTNSLNSRGLSNMTDEASLLWKDLLPMAASIPFNKVFVQFDQVSESFFFVYDFNSGQRLEATTYVDNEDDGVYFSVFSKDKLFFQNILPRDVFFKKAASTWKQLSQSHA